MARPLSGGRGGLLALSVTGILWGTIGVSVRLLQLDGMSSPAIAFWRFVCAVVVGVPVIGWSRVVEIGRQFRRPARLLLLAGTGLLFQLLYFYAVRNVGAAVATLVSLGLGPIVLHLTEAVSARAAPPPRSLVVLVLALAGLALVAAGHPSSEVAPHPVAGLLQAFGCGLAFAANTIWSRPMLRRLPPLSITFSTSLIGLVLLLPVVAITGWDVPRSAVSLGGTVWLGVVTTVVAYGLFYRGLRSTPGSTAMIVTLLEPVTAFVLAAALLGEPVTAAGVGGGALLLAAVAALYLRPRALPG